MSGAFSLCQRKIDWLADHLTVKIMYECVSARNGMKRVRRLFLAICAMCTLLSSTASANGLLDGRVFEGMIGPAESPDLPDKLFFNDGFFWSEICTRCGFEPGVYTAEESSGGIVFRGVLESDSRGQFDYEGLVTPDGGLAVSIRWERKRWYWTSSREIVFQGQAADAPGVTLLEIKSRMAENDPDANPLCARF